MFVYVVEIFYFCTHNATFNDKMGGERLKPDRNSTLQS